MTVIDECLVAWGSWIMVMPAGELIRACDQLEVEQRHIVGKHGIKQKTSSYDHNSRNTRRYTLEV